MFTFLLKPQRWESGATGYQVNSCWKQADLIDMSDPLEHSDRQGQTGIKLFTLLHNWFWINLQMMG